MAKPIDFYFDFSSPYGYLAAEKIDGIAARHDREVTWRPYLLGATFKIVGNAPLVTVPMKGDYARRDILRSARLMGVPLTFPDNFPVNSVAACRTYYWLSDQDADLAKRFAQSAYRGYFQHNRDVGSPEIVIETAVSLGVDRDALTAALEDQAVKDRLRAEVDAAIERGIFGSPFIVIDDEPFWGADRLDQVDKWLETGGW